MKSSMLFTIALSAVMVLASLGGCASSGQKVVGVTDVDGIRVTTVSAWDNDPWTTNAKTLTMVQSERKVVEEEQQPQCVYYAPPPVQQVQPCPPPHYAPPPAQSCPQVRHNRPQQKQPPKQVYVPAPQPPPCCCPRCQQIVTRPTCEQTKVIRLVNTRVINSNNQGGDGWANGAFKGAVGDALIGGSMMGAAAIIRPARFSVRGGGGGSASSSAAAAASSAAAAGH